MPRGRGRDDFLESLPDLVAEAADRGQPVVLRLDREPAGHVVALMRTLGVPIEVVLVTAPKMEKGRDGVLRSTATHHIVNGEPLGLTTGEMVRRHEAVLDQTPTATGCGLCDWNFTGTAAEGREAFAAHRAGAHPDAPRPPKRGQPRKPGQGADKVRPVEASRPAAGADGPAVDGHGTDGGSDAASTATGVDGPKNRGRRTKWTRESVIAAIQAHAAEHGRVPSATDWAKADPAGKRPTSSAVIKRIAPWSELIEAAGYPKPGNGQRPTVLARPVVDDPVGTGSATDLPGEERLPQAARPVQPARADASGPGPDHQLQDLTQSEGEPTEPETVGPQTTVSRAPDAVTPAPPGQPITTAKPGSPSENLVDHAPTLALSEPETDSPATGARDGAGDLQAGVAAGSSGSLNATPLIDELLAAGPQLQAEKDRLDTLLAELNEKTDALTRVLELIDSVNRDLAEIAADG